MTTTAPRVAPLDTPSVSGEASGFRRNAWNTTPATANAPPTRTAASTRGSRATKKTCASTLSAKAIVRSNARESEIAVVPTSGANVQTTIATAPNPATVTTSRRRTSERPAKRNHHQPPGARVDLHVRVHSVERADVVTRQHLARRPRGNHPPCLQQHERGAKRCREVKIVRGHHHRHAAIAIEPREQ